MTYVATGEGWLYVAAVLDQASRKVLGLKFGNEGMRRTGRVDLLHP